MIYIFLFFLWMILIGDFSDFSIAIGLFFVIISNLITGIFFERKIKGMVEILISTIGTILNMYKTTFQFIPLIFKKHYSGLTFINLKDRTEVEKVAIADCITLTPKTLFVDVDESNLIIHRVEDTPEKAHSSEGVWEGDLFE
ncbi:MAG: Na+/H+ antiporter subunit E [Thermotogota bacterium]